MPYVTLDEFLEQATPYEMWRTPIDPQLRQAAHWGVGSCSIAFLLLIFMPPLPVGAEVGFFWILGPLYYWLWSGLYGIRFLLLALNLAALIAYGMAFLSTNELQAGRALWHWLIFSVAVIGGSDFFVLGLAFLMLAVNAVIWVIAIIVATAIAAMVGVLFLLGLITGGE